jgi:hypothetical protein
MRIVHMDELPMEDRLTGGRAGTWQRRRVMNGDHDGPGGFSLVVYYHNGSFYSPRHHHNFDQFRYQIDGTADFHRNGKMTPGVLGYFPEGAYYGPTSGPPHTVAVLQFGGPSGSGFLTPDQHKQAIEELRLTGTFEKGVFRKNAGEEGRKNQDSFEAVWEHVNQRPVNYPKPQYTVPIMIDTDHFPSLPLEGAPGVLEKPLGTFTNCRIRAARYQLDAGSTLQESGRGIFIVLSGGGSVNREAVRALTTIYLGEGEAGTFEALESMEVLRMGLPSIKLMAAPASKSLLSAAA